MPTPQRTDRDDPRPPDDARPRLPEPPDDDLALLWLDLGGGD